MNTIYISKHSCKPSTETSNSLKLVLTGAALALFAGASVSCGTMHGMGHDIVTAGDEIQEAAR